MNLLLFSQSACTSSTPSANFSSPSFGSLPLPSPEAAPADLEEARLHPIVELSLAAVGPDQSSISGSSSSSSPFDVPPLFLLVCCPCVFMLSEASSFRLSLYFSLASVFLSNDDLLVYELYSSPADLDARHRLFLHSPSSSLSPPCPCRLLKVSHGFITRTLLAEKTAEAITSSSSSPSSRSSSSLTQSRSRRLFPFGGPLPPFSNISTEFSSQEIDQLGLLVWTSLHHL